MALPTQTPRKISGGILAVILSIVSLGLITLWSFEGGIGSDASGPLHSVRSAISTAVQPFDYASSLVGQPVETVGTLVSDATASAETLSELRAQNEELAAMVMRLEENRMENERLSELLGISSAYELEATAARILKTSVDSWNQTITIDKGSNDNLAVGMPVMSPNGLIGQIESIGPTTSQVRLITDQSSGVSVFLQGNRSEGVLTGSIERLLYLSYISLDTKIIPGDVVVTSGAGGVYPKGIVIGEITSVTYSPSDVYQTIVVKPTARVKYYEEVLVLTGRQTEVVLQVAPTSGAAAGGATPAASDSSGASEGSGISESTEGNDSDDSEGSNDYEGLNDSEGSNNTSGTGGE